jgi:hypothetical protein
VGPTARLNFVLRTDQPEGGKFGGAPLVPPPPPVPGDFDGDGDVDLFDHAAFVLRMSGPGSHPTRRRFGWDRSPGAPGSRFGFVFQRFGVFAFLRFCVSPPPPTTTWTSATWRSGRKGSPGRKNPVAAAPGSDIARDPDCVAGRRVLYSRT